MRVQDPPKYAEVLLNLVRPTEGWTAERIKKMYGNAEVDIQFPTFIPVNLTYQTAFVDDDGKLQIRRDIYGIDGAHAGGDQERARHGRDGAGSAEGFLRRQRRSSVHGRPEPLRQSGGFFEQLFGTRTSQQQVRPPEPGALIQAFVHRAGGTC